MALITNNISGSASDSWRVGITGSIVVANPGAAGDVSGNAFVLPGNDVGFFVSGSKGGKGGANRTVSVFGGDAVVSGSLTVGTGSITITSNEIQFLGGAARIFSGSDGLTFVDSSGTKTLSSLGTGGSGGDTAAQYLVLAATGSLSAERVFTAGTGIAVTDGGAGGNFTVAIDNSVVATLTGSTFSGGIAGTTLSMSGNITGSNVLVNGDLTVKGNTTLGDANGDVVTITGTSVNLTSTSATSITHTGASGQNLTISSTSGNTIIESTIFNGNDVTVPGNLTVNGTLVSIDTTNLRVKDPVVLIGSGSGAADSKSAIAFGSGSAGGTNSLIVGSVGGGNVIAAAQQDVQAGDLPASSLSFANLVPFRASKFEVGGTSAYVTSSAGTDITVFANGGATVQSDTSKVVLSGATGFGTSFEIGGVQFAELKDSSSNVQFGAVGGKQITVSGSVIQLNTGGSVNIQRNGVRVGQLLGTAATDFRFQAMDASGSPTSAVITGSSVDLGANSQGINLNFAGVGRGTISYSAGAGAMQVGTLTGVQLALSGANGVNVTHGTPGVTFTKDQGSSGYLVIEGDGPSDARLRAAADLVLRADGNDIKFNNGTQTVLTLATAGSDANFQGASNQQVTIGSVGSGGMTVSGSTVTANVGSGGFVFQRDGVAELHVNAVGFMTTISGSDLQNVTLGSGTGNTAVILSGSTITANAGTNGFIFQKDGVSKLLVNTAAAGSTTTISGSASQNVTLAAGTGATTLALSGSTVNLVGSTVNLYQDATLVAFAGTVSATQGFFPNADSTFNLGDSTRRWKNIYTGDLHLRNERGDYTLIEEPDFLSIRFNKTGKRYKFLLERVPELDEPV